MEKYSRTEMDIIRFETTDVIATTGGGICTSDGIQTCTGGFFGYSGGGSGNGR